MKKQNSKMNKNIKDVVCKLEERFEGINIVVYFFESINTYYIVIPEDFSKNKEFQKFAVEIYDDFNMKNVTNFYFVDKINHEKLEKVYVSTPQFETV